MTTLGRNWGLTWLALILPLLALAITLTLGVGTTQAVATTFTVNSTNDVNDGTCDVAHCSLREAISAANIDAGTDTIAFSIPGVGPHTIQPTSTMLSIGDAVIIDGYTQPGASPNSNGPGSGSNAVLMIELDGSLTGGDGLHIFAAGTRVQGLVINRFSRYGIRAGSGAVIAGNFIGTDLTGTTGLGNGSAGIAIFHGANNTIGGTAPGDRNVLSANGNGIFIFGESAIANQIIGNLIGTDITGTVALGISNTGVAISRGVGNSIGGETAEAGNVISGNNLGVHLSGNTGSPSIGNVIQGNYIGTDVTGTAALGNEREGIQIDTSLDNTVGGSAPGARNLISANGEPCSCGRGIFITSLSDGENLVLGNYIGTDVTGTTALGNFGQGVLISDSQGNTIGGTTAGAANLISGNRLSGIRIHGSDATGNLVQGNLIGTDFTGTESVSNARGVFVSGSSIANTIGGTSPGAGNIIAENRAEGIRIDSGTGNAIYTNSIFANGNLGIDLARIGVVTPNDIGDGDVGANNLQNFPDLLSATGTTVAGTLNSTPNTDYRLEFFSSSSCDSSGHGEGQTFLGFTTTTSDGAGDAAFSASLTTAVPGGTHVTSTATDPDGNTSEFSACFFVEVPPPTETPTATQTRPTPIGGFGHYAEAGPRPVPLETTNPGSSGWAVVVGIAAVASLVAMGVVALIARKRRA